MTVKPASFVVFALVSGGFFWTKAPSVQQEAALSGLSPVSVSQEDRSPDNPVELGDVHWQRDLESGFAAAKKSNKPVFILFQEVPGCSNCTRYGSQVLRHPLVVEAIETFLEPVCIYNNKKGKDAEALQRYGEPAWNNPVVRIVNSAGEDLVERMAHFGSVRELVAGMRQVLAKTGQPIPAYLHLLEEEVQARERSTETATFSMYCFWSGESTFGTLPGVIETAPGFQNGREVVRVSFDPAVTNQAQLSALTQPKGIAACSDNAGFRSDKEPKYYLAQTFWRAVPMTTLQACRANSLVGSGRSPEAVLSPRQIALGQKIKALPEYRWKNVIGQPDLVKAWELSEKGLK